MRNLEVVARRLQYRIQRDLPGFRAVLDNTAFDIGLSIYDLAMLTGCLYLWFSFSNRASIGNSPAAVEPTFPES